VRRHAARSCARYTGSRSPRRPAVRLSDCRRNASTSSCSRRACTVPKFVFERLWCPVQAARRVAGCSEARTHPYRRSPWSCPDLTDSVGEVVSRYRTVWLTGVHGGFGRRGAAECALVTGTVVAASDDRAGARQPIGGSQKGELLPVEELVRVGHRDEVWQRRREAVMSSDDPTAAYCAAAPAAVTAAAAADNPARVDARPDMMSPTPPRARTHRDRPRCPGDDS
jgi:hypothetical protein